MVRKILVVVMAVAIGAFCLSGCKKRSSEAPPEEEAIKTTAEYEADAKKEISEENMAEELEKIEKAVEDEIGKEESGG